MNILALDIATKTGWANNTASGVWDLSIKRDESSGMRLIRFKAKLNEIIRIDRPDVVVYERVSGHYKNALIVASELVGVMKILMDENGIDYRAYSASEIKKHATGKGNAKKTDMIQACIDKLCYTPIDDNEADAKWIHHLAMEDLT